MTFKEIQKILDDCKFPEYQIHAAVDGRGAWYLQATYVENDVDYNVNELQSTRRWLLSPLMIRGEIVQTAFKCIMTSYEHRAREHFQYRGRRIFGPHQDIDKLWDISDKEYFRETDV